MTPVRHFGTDLLNLHRNSYPRKMESMKSGNCGSGSGSGSGSNKSGDEGHRWSQKLLEEHNRELAEEEDRKKRIRDRNWETQGR